jgi:hypothetical protein
LGFRAAPLDRARAKNVGSAGTDVATRGRQREPKILAFCPSDLPVKISKVRFTSDQVDGARSAPVRFVYKA